MKNLSKNIVWVLVGLMLLSALYSVIAGKLSEAGEMTLSELVTKINSGEVEEIIVSDSTLGITLGDGHKFSAQKEAEASITETLNNYNVDTKKLAEVSLKVESTGAFNFLMGVILPILRSEEHTSELQSQFHLVCRLLL